MCFVMIRTIGPVGLIIVDGLCCKSGEKKKTKKKVNPQPTFFFSRKYLDKNSNFKEQKPKDEPKQIQSELHFHVGRGHLSSGVNLT